MKNEVFVYLDGIYSEGGAISVDGYFLSINGISLDFSQQ